MATFNRRDFLRGAGVTGAAAVAGCNLSYDPKTPVENIYPYVSVPEDELPGVANYFSTACTGCAAGCGLVARSKEGRVVMVEGNPDHPHGPGLCVRGHMGLLATYSPDRVKGPTLGGKLSTWDETLAQLGEALKKAKAEGKTVAWLGQYRTGSMARLLEAFAGATGMKRVHWEPLGLETLVAASRAAFGTSALPTYELSGAHVILSFGMDFLGTAYGMMGMAKGWAKAKNPAVDGFVARYVAVEPRVSATSAQADNHFRPAPGSEGMVAMAIAKLVAEKKGYSGPAAGLLGAVNVDDAATKSGISAEKLREIAGWVADAPAAVALPGGFSNSTTDATGLALASLLINEVSGNIGKTVLFGREMTPGQVNGYADVKALLDDCKAGNVAVLFLDGVNPVYNLPPADGAGEALDKVPTLVQLADEADDSTRPTTWLLPPGSALESWGDAGFYTGVHTLQQPAMTKLQDTRPVGDVLLALAKVLGVSAPAAAPAAIPADAAATAAGTAPVAAPAPMGLDAADWAGFVKERWKREVMPAGLDFEQFWVQARQRGGHFELCAGTCAAWTGSAEVKVGAPIAADGKKVLVVFPSTNLGDGRHANRPWAQELPDPISTVPWTTWAEIHPKAAERLGVVEGDTVQVEGDGGAKATLRAFISKGVGEDTVAVVLGNGHTGMGRYAKGRGFNPMAFLGSGTDSQSGALATLAGAVKVSRGSAPAESIELCGNMDQAGRSLANAVAASVAVEKQGGEAGSAVELHELPWDERLERQGLHDMYPEPQHPTYRFAMAIDTNQCTGCGACIIACNLENNIPFVGPDQVTKGRGMSWIRMDRFWEGDGEHQDVRHLLALCQHCSHAPCEGVCPVLATYHNLDGLNAMIYNRCVGTRYCANNCPYTARRFNYHTFTWPESMHLMLNPDVSVREMGVMEKCTFCSHRLRAVKDSWRDLHQPAPDAALQKVTACAAACPTDAIVFGNANNGEGLLGRQYKDIRTYTLLGELNTKPGVRYLAKVRHDLAETKTAHGAAGAPAGHEGGEAHGAEHKEG